MARRKVLDVFRHSQHRTEIVGVCMPLPLISSFPRRRWNFGKANCNAFANDLDKYPGWIPPTSNNYGHFVGAVNAVAKGHIPRGFRQDYTTGWDERSETLVRNSWEAGSRKLPTNNCRASMMRVDKWTETVESMASVF